MDFWSNIWNILTVFFWAFVLISALLLLFSVISDLFRDKELSGIWKAVWIFFLIGLPILTSLIYLVARGEGMAKRSQREIKEAKEATDSYIKSVAGSSPADELLKAKQLFDSGVISEGEFVKLKGQILSTQSAIA